MDPASETKKPTERETKVRDWDASFNWWANHGTPKDSLDYPIPGPHPDKDSVWNIDQRAYCMNTKKIEWDPNAKDGDEACEEY